MAQIRFYKNMFEEKFYECKYDSNKTLLQHIEDYSTKNVYTEFYVECYDSETGETSYEPLIEEASEISVVIYANGISVKEDYEVKKEDLITIIYLPLGTAEELQTGLNWGSIIGGTVLVALGVIACFTGYGAIVGVPLIISGIMTASTGVVGLIVQDKQKNAKHTSSGLETGESSPDIRGANNELITGNPYPFVIGKHLITPQIVGAPYTEYSGIRGEDAYIHVMYCLGYGPVSVSDLKLEDFVLTKNTKNLISGEFDDIDPYWEDNEIEIELIQGQPNFIGYSKNYPNVVVQEDVKSNILHIADNSITELSKVIYKGRGFSNGYRTNTVVFTDSCPIKFTVVLDAPNGLYKTRNETRKDGDNSVSYTAYSSLTLYYAIQWRFYDETKEPSKADGSDFDDWNNIVTWNGQSCAVSLDQNLINADKNNHAGNSYDVSVYDNFKDKAVCNFGRFSGKDYISQVRLCSTVTISKEDAKKIIDTKGPNKIKSIEVRVLRVSPCYIDQEKVTNTGTDSSNGPWSYCDVINLDSISTIRFDETELKDNDVYKAETVQSKKDFDKFSYISLKAKADSNGTLQGQLDSFNCVIQSFSPIWNSETKEWLPEGVQRETYYYGYGEKLLTQPDDWTQNYTDYLIFDDVNSRFVKNNSLNFVVGTHYKPADMSSKYKEAFVDKNLYEEFRQKGFNWHRWQKGSNYIEKIRSEIFNNKVNNNYYLPESAKKYLNNSSASGFMLACVGPQNGPVAFGYNEINLLSVTDWYENSLGVEDGSLDIDNNPVKIDFCANGYIYDRTKLEDLLKQIAFTGRATYTYDETGKIKIIMDKPVDYPVGVINQQNCKEFSIFYNYNTLPAGFRVGFNDENDGYLNNSFTCWSDGNSEANYKGQVEPYQIPFVTNPVQCWSLMRYLLAIRCFQRETVIAKLGISSALYSLGDVVAIASDELLIGNGSSRVQSPIQDDEYIYGLILDSTYHYDGDTDSDGRCTQGISVFQVKKYGKSRLVTFRLAKDGETQCGYTLRKGTTNIVLFETPVLRDFSNDPSDGALKYSFNTGDICLLGLAETTYSRYIITKIKTDRNNSVSYTLMNYDESFYKYGEKLPVFKKNMTTPQLLQKPLTFSEVPTTMRELNEKITENKDKVEVITPLPTTPVLSSIKATKDSLQILFNKSEIPNFSNLIIEISKDEGITYSQSYVVYDDGVYPFDRELDGYPEKEDLARWRIRAKSVNAYGNQSLNYSSTMPIDITDYGTWVPPVISAVNVKAQELGLIYDWVCTPLYTNRVFYGNVVYDIVLKYGTTIRDSQELSQTFFEYTFDRSKDGYPETDANYNKYNSNQTGATLLSKYKVYVKSRDLVSGKTSIEKSNNSIVTTDYKTWYVEKPEVNITASSRNISLTMKQGNDNYGINKFYIGVKKASDTKYYHPFEEYKDSSGKFVTPYDSVDNYKTSNTEYKELNLGYYSQIMPLEGQNDKNPTPTATTYQFSVFVANEIHTGKSNYELSGITATAQATGAKDIVANAITNNKLAEGCVTADKIHAGTITADQMAATDLSTAGVTVGKISGKGLNLDSSESQSNFWNLEDGKEEFRVGNDIAYENADGTPKNSNAAYIHYKKDSNGAGQLFIALSKFFISSIASIIKGLFKIQTNDSKDFVVINPEATANTSASIAAKTMQIKGSVETSSKTTTNTLTITSGNDTSVSSFGNEPLSIGSATGFNIGIDNNEILARNNGKISSLFINAASLYLNDQGGDVYISTSGKFSSGGLVYNGGAKNVDGLEARTYFKGDNNGRPTYRLLWNITDFFNTEINSSTIGNCTTRGFVGFVLSQRENSGWNSSGYHIGYIDMNISYRPITNGFNLYYTNESYVPYIIKDTANSNYYLALKVVSAGRGYRLFGRFYDGQKYDSTAKNYTGGSSYVNTEINATDANGTLPAGYELISTYNSVDLSPKFNNIWNVSEVSKAHNDGSGNNIVDTYATKTELTDWNCANANYTGDPNDCEIGKWYSINTTSNPTNMPASSGYGWANVITFAANNNSSYKQQLCFYINYELMYMRTQINGHWGKWTQFMREGDKATNSDRIDGYHMSISNSTITFTKE